MQQRYIAVAYLLSLSVHLVVLFCLYLRPSLPVSIQQNTVSVYFDHTASAPLAKAKIQTKTPRLLTTPAKSTAATSAQQAVETPSQAKPETLAEPLDAPQNIPASGKIESISSLTRIPGSLRKIEAAYPASERRAGIQAYVLAEIIIDAQGKVQDVTILKSGGSAFDATVIEALKKSAFTPGYIGDKAVSVRISIPFRFNLK